MSKRAPSAVACLVAVIFLAGCGGGGGGGSTSLYTGITSPATFTDNNAEEIALQAYQAGDLSASTVSVLGVSGNRNAAVGSPNVLTLVRLLKESAERIPALPGTAVSMNSSPPALPMAMVTVDDTVDDGIGGIITFHLEIDDQTGVFRGTFRFTNWHGDGGGVISGLTNVSGEFDMTGGFFTHIRFSFNPVTMEDGPQSASIYGTMDLYSDGVSSASASMNIFLQDNNSLETVWISNYTLNLAEGSDYVDASVSGTIYLPNHGCVVASTPTPFRYYAGYSLPSSGVLLLTGSGGRSASLVVNSAIPESPGYHVEADLDGDSVFEWTGSGHPWS